MSWMTKIRVEESGYDLSGRPVWRLLGPLAFRSKDFGIIVVPPDFRTNYASVPRWPIIFWAAGDRAHKEAAIHDWLYTSHQLPRPDADRLFLEMLLLNEKVLPELAQAMFKAVDWFGGASWRDESNIVQDEHVLAEIRKRKGL